MIERIRHFLFPKKYSFKKRIGLFFSKLAYPFVLLFQFFRNATEKLPGYFKDHKEFVVAFTYGVGLVLQIGLIYFLFGIEGIGYVSISFSILLLATLLLLGSFGIPIVAVLLVAVLITAVVLFWWLLLIVLLLLILTRRYFEKVRKSKVRWLDKKMDAFYVWYVLFLVAVIGLSSFFHSLNPKSVEITLDEGKKTYGDLLFYNKDYYFLRSCGEKVVIPETEAKSVRFVCAGESCKKDAGRNAKENGKYAEYCRTLGK